MAQLFEIFLEHQPEIASAITAIIGLFIRNAEKRKLRREGKLHDNFFEN